MSDATHAPERWAPIPGWEGYFEVSDRGVIRTVGRVMIRSNGAPFTCRGRVRRLQLVNDGRWGVTLRAGGKQRRHLVAPLVLSAFVGLRPPGLDACHNNGNPRDDRVENLRWDTASGNALDKRAHGTDHNVNKARCPRGHRLEAPNLRTFYSRVGRECLACHRARAAGQYARRCGRPFDFIRVADGYYARIMEES